jgi:hypothetical protein
MGCRFALGSEKVAGVEEGWSSAAAVQCAQSAELSTT